MMKSPFRVNWMDRVEVISYTKALSMQGPQQVVFKHPNRLNYNITFKSRTDQYRPEWVVFTADSSNPQYV